MKRKIIAAIFTALVTGRPALAEWTEIQSVTVPNDPFNETYSVRPYVSKQLLVTKEGCCRHVQLSYLAFGKDEAGSVRLQLTLQPLSASEDPDGRRGQTFEIQSGSASGTPPGSASGSTIYELQVGKSTYDHFPESGCTYHFYVQQ